PGFVFRNNILHGGGWVIVGDGVGSGVAVLDAYAPAWVTENNVFVGPWPNETGLQPTYPPGVFPPRNLFANSFAEVGFVNLGGGDMLSAEGRPSKKAGSDGKDPGADLGALSAAPSGTGPPPPTDTTPPSVSILAPASGTAVSGALTFVVSATDNVGVTTLN